MSTTAQQVFDITMGLIGALSASGATDTADTADYKKRTLLILNNLRGELYPYSDTYVQATPGIRPINAYIPDFSTAIDLDDFLAQTVMPHGLASELLKEDDPSMANYHLQKYQELLQQWADIPSAFEEIEDIYGGLGPGEFGAW